MSKKTIITVAVLILCILMILAHRHFLPYGRLDKNSDLCRKPELFQNPLKCRLSGCIWGSGDLTGPPFCGASSSSKEQACLDNGGQWLRDYSECELVFDLEAARAKCIAMDGEFIDCASPCRYRSDDELACVAVCIPVCKF